MDQQDNTVTFNAQLLSLNSKTLSCNGHLLSSVLWPQGYAVAQLVEALRYKLEGRGLDSR